MCNPCAPCLKAYDCFTGLVLSILTLIVMGIGIGGLAALYSYHPGLLGLVFIVGFIMGLVKNRAHLKYSLGFGPKPPQP